MWEKVEKYFSDYCEHSSIIGFNYVAEKRSKGERVLWLLLVILAIIISIYFIMQMWYKYDENPFIVSLATRAQPIFTIPFPAITICPAAKSQRNIFNYTDVVHRLWDEKKITEYEMETTQYIMTLCGNEEVNLFLNESIFFTEKFYKRLDKLDPVKSLLERTFCKFMNKEENCSKIFVPIFLDGGICYSFNLLTREEIYKPETYQYSNFHQHSMKSSWTNDNGYPKDAKVNVYPRRALKSGENSLLIMLPQNVADTDYVCSENIGYKVLIHTPNTIPVINPNFFIASPNEATMISIKPELMTTSEIVKSYKLSDRQCYFSDERYLKFFKSYTQENCYLECRTNYTSNKCGCVSFYMPHENATKICGNGMFDCVEEAENELILLEMSMESSKSSKCNCLPLCTQLSYETSFSSARFNFKEFIASRKKLGLDLNELDNLSFSLIQIYFKSDYFTPSEKNELYGAFDFLSNFGGLLGLFTGFSLLSAVELIYFITVRLWCNKRLYNDLSGPPETAAV